MRGYFGIGIFHGKAEVNLGTLWRSASLMGAAFIFTIGKRYKKQASDTMQSWRHIPLYNYENLDEFYRALPYDCRIVGIELHPDAKPIKEYKHLERCIYLLGAEDNGLSNEAVMACHELVQLPGKHSMNVAVAGSIVMFDRLNKH